MAKGAAWMTTFKVVDRCTGIVSTAILARLLVPGDFGLVALATSTIAMLEVLGAFGLETALVQRADVSRQHFDSVWTFNVLFGLSLGVIVIALAWPVASFYGDPRLFSVLLILGLRQAILGFENVGIVAFRKDLAFDKEFKLPGYKKAGNDVSGYIAAGISPAELLGSALGQFSGYLYCCRGELRNSPVQATHLVSGI